MKFLVSRDALQKPLMAVTNVVEKRQTLPILANLLIEVKGSTLSLTGTDLEVEIRSTLPISNGENGIVTVPARKFSDICRALPDGADLTVSLDDDRIVIRSGKSRFALASLPAQDFPVVDADSNVHTFALPQFMLKKAIARTYFAMAQQDVRYYLNGMLFEISPKSLVLVATDGHRLALSETEHRININENQQVIMPRKGVVELLRLLDDNDEPVQIELGNSYIRIRSDAMCFTSKLIDGRFPDYQNVLPKNPDKVVVSDRNTLRQSLSRAAILSNEKYRGVRLAVSKGSLKIFAHNPDQEEAEEELSVDYSGQELEIGFNVSYLLDAIAAGDSELVQISLSDPNSCCLIQGVGVPDNKYVVMPMRL
ncbi:MAG: DNA polymerase III subunit beta [Gammaproteobacteria bacterium]|nr:DNA polymerase III subunit beta [Gammaproteobacteria bacterium]